MRLLRERVVMKVIWRPEGKRAARLDGGGWRYEIKASSTRLGPLYNTTMWHVKLFFSKNKIFFGAPNPELFAYQFEGHQSACSAITLQFQKA
jgi:hypothetical protein